MCLKVYDRLMEVKWKKKQFYSYLHMIDLCTIDSVQLRV
jgi:hypothetical protein